MGYVGGMTATKILPQQLMQVLGAGMVSQEQTRTIYAYGPEAVVFALLMLCQHLAELYAQLASVTFYPNGGANSSGPPKGAERQNAQRFGPDKQVLPFGEEKASLAQNARSPFDLSCGEVPATKSIQGTKPAFGIGSYMDCIPPASLLLHNIGANTRWKSVDCGNRFR